MEELLPGRWPAVAEAGRNGRVVENALGAHPAWEWMERLPAHRSPRLLSTPTMPSAHVIASIVQPARPNGWNPASTTPALGAHDRCLELP